MEDFRRQFLTEAAANLCALTEDWRTAEALSDTLRRDAFRTLHTIKGTAQTFGFTSSSRLAHALETLLSVSKNEKNTTADQRKILFLEGIGLLIECLEQRNFEIPDSFWERVRNLFRRHPNRKRLRKTFRPPFPTSFSRSFRFRKKRGSRRPRKRKKHILF